MAMPNYLAPEEAFGTTASYASCKLAGLDMVYAWQEDRLIYLTLGREVGALVTRMKNWMPEMTFVQANDDHNFARQIENAWRSDRLIDVKMTLYGTPFRHKVWKALLAIPSTSNPTYGDIAREIGSEKAHRAVGTSVGANPICLLVPCHRVLPKSGGVGNYGCGPDIKEFLLAEEQGFSSQRLAA